MSEENQNAVEIKDGFYDAVVRDADIIENRFDPNNGFEIEIEVGVFDEQKKPLTKAEIYLELSSRPGVGNNAGKTSYAISIEKLQKLGFEGGEDLARIKEIVGKPCRVSYSVKDSKGIPYKYGPRWSLTFQRPTKKVDPKVAMAAIKQMLAAGPSAVPAFNMGGAGAPPPPPPAGDPFANL